MTSILLIDDDELVRNSLTIVLEEAGYAVTQAGNGNEGMRCFSRQAFDLVVTDLIMPEKEGVSVLLDIRKAAPQQKVIVISGGGRTKNTGFYLDVVKQLGADGMLEKPFDASTFSTLVSQVLAA